MMKPPYPLLFFSSLSILAFEITLIRIFSIRFSYHYASLIISISMIGVVLGGVYTFVKGSLQRDVLPSSGDPSVVKPCSPSIIQQVNTLVYSLCLSYPLIMIFSSLLPLDYYKMLWEDIQLLYLFLFILTLTVPFFLYGLMISNLLLFYPRLTDRLYGSDLSGAACGVVMVIFLLDYVKIEFLIILFSAILLMPLLLTQRASSTLRHIHPSGNVHFFGGSRTLLIIIPVCLYLPIATNIFELRISPYKNLMQALRDDEARHVQTIYSSHSRVDVFENPRMKFAPGLSLTYNKPVPRGTGIAIDGDVTGVLLDDKILDQYDFFNFLPSSLPYLLTHPGDVLIVGFRSGLDVLMPYYFGANNVYVTEKDSSVRKLLAARYMEKSPYRKCLQNTSGRMFTREIEREMGIISISRTGFFPAGTFGLQEDYDLTLEALKGYITSLKESGMLCIQLFLLPPPRYELRLMNNIILAMYGLRIESPDRHLIVLRSWDTMSFFVKKSPFTIEELRKISDFAESREFDVVFPDLAVSRTFITGPDYRDIFMNLMHWKGLSVVKENYPFDIGVTTDDKPFLHYFLRLKHIKEIYALTGRKWTYFLYEGMALPFVLMFLSIFSIALFVATFLFFRRGNSNSKQLTCNFELTTLCYFAVIGFAFMFIEVFFIHLFILPLGSPAASFATVLVTLLLSTGFGSIMSGYVKGKKVFYAMCTILFLLMMYYLLPAYLYTYSFSFLFLIPTGFLLGFYFPAGIKLLCGHDSRTIPLAYAMNGAASIISPPLASVIAVSLGLKILLILSCVLYGLAILIIGNKLYLMHRPAGHFISSEPLRSLEQR